MINYKDLLGIPYKLHGRDRTGYDCYGLAIEVLRRMGFNLTDLRFLCGEVKRMKETNKGDYSDIILFFDKNGHTVHIGVLLNEESFIHCDMYGVRVSGIKEFGSNWRLFKWHD